MDSLKERHNFWRELLLVKDVAGVNDTKFEKTTARVRLVAQYESSQTQEHFDLNLIVGARPTSAESVAQIGQKRIGLSVMSLVVELLGLLDVCADVLLEGSLKNPR